MTPIDLTFGNILSDQSVKMPYKQANRENSTIHTRKDTNKNKLV
jgi:hypothetical protein